MPQLKNYDAAKIPSFNLQKLQNIFFFRQEKFSCFPILVNKPIV